jgi:AcrR family transcriptional regulator
MGWRHGHGRGWGRESYHHGNLREALVDAALELIAARGPGGFSFAELARAAGVSPAAPYRHFRDRHAVVAEIARRGFALFAADLAAAWHGGQPDPLTALLNCGRAYLAFARKHPALYAAMFTAELPPDELPPGEPPSGELPSGEDAEPGDRASGDASLKEAGDRAFAVLRGAAERLVAELDRDKRPPALMVALHIWALSHGIAALFLRAGCAASPLLPSTPEDLLEAGVRIYLQSLGYGARAPSARTQ